MAAGTDTRNAALDRLSAIVAAYKIIPSMRQASERLGRQTLKLVRRLYPALIGSLDVAPPHHAVVVGAAGRMLELPCRDLLMSYAHSLAAGNLAAATRCMPISPEQAQIRDTFVRFCDERIIPRAAGDRAKTMAQAMAIVDDLPARPAAEAVVGVGIYLGMAASFAIVAFGLTIVVKRASQVYVVASPDDDV
jgi:urease accessory protein UreF